MAERDDYVELVKQAQRGDEGSLNRLAELARERLRAYIYRLTLQNDLTEDIVQDSMLEMIKFLDQLERADRFWPWLRTIAVNKFYHQGKRQQRQRTTAMFWARHSCRPKDGEDGLANLVSQNQRQIVIEAMRRLRPRHRQVLVLRCYEELGYSQIAQEMGCSEFNVRMLFFRAKKSLAKQLSRRGLGKGSLLAALTLFGKMTAPASAAPVSSIAAVSLKVGLVPALIGTAGTKLGIGVGTAITVTAITLSGITITHDKTTKPSHHSTNGDIITSKANFEYPSQLVDAYDPDGDGWQGVKRYGSEPVQISPEQWLVGPPESNLSSVILPVNHWVELKFRGEILDGPGYDILLTEWGANGEQVRVFITDGAGNESLLGTAIAGTSGQQVLTEIGLDISGISLPFVPYALRILGTKGGGETPGFDLGSVSARMYVSRDDY